MKPHIPSQAAVFDIYEHSKETASSPGGAVGFTGKDRAIESAVQTG